MSTESKRGPEGQGGQFLLMAASLVVVIAGLRAAASVILPFLISIFLAMVTLPLLNWLRGKRVPTALAVLMTLVLAVSVVVLLAVLLGGSIGDFVDRAPEYRVKIERLYQDGLGWLDQRGVNVATLNLRDLIDPGAAVDVATKALRGTAAVLSNLLLVLLTIVFILLEAAGFPQKLQAAFGRREQSERFERIKLEVQRYLAAKTVISLTTGALVGIAMSLLGVDFAFLWGCIAFMLNYIPNLGSIIAAVLPVALSLLQFGPGRALAVAAVFVAVNVGLGNLLEPQLMGRRMGLSTLVVFTSLVFWGWVWGPVGMLLSVPLTMILKIMLENTEDMRWVAVLLGPTPKGEAPTPRT